MCGLGKWYVTDTKHNRDYTSRRLCFLCFTVCVNSFQVIRLNCMNRQIELPKGQFHPIQPKRAYLLSCKTWEICVCIRKEHAMDVL